ncbi:MAG: EAL domain-containing protein [Moraxellaceae bacterium]|nr:MAG: EAL domain-containing protein [Moraxellaceae bacterium]
MAIEDWAVQKTVQHNTAFNHPCLQLNLSISGKSLADIHFIRRLGQQLAIVRPGSIAFCVAESDWIHLHERYAKNLRLMQELALHWIIDDFGGGPSSLIYLSSLPIKTLKLDARLTQAATNAGGHHAIKAIVDMGKNMGLQVIAKGVDTPQQLTLMRRLQCPLVQGAVVKPVSDFTSALNMLDKPLA